MVGGSTQQQEFQFPSSATTTTTKPEEEFLKRNTDCVYFLASPLTCKKGSECEYRHSDIARLNPRDCWYWLNGNCLNPKCAFRHPPLDGLLGADISTPTAGPSVPQSQPPATPAANAVYASGKQGVPCIFFQKGFCLKGDRCPFLHGPNSGNNKAAPSPAATTVTEPSALKKTFGAPEKSVQEHNFRQINVPKSVELPPLGKPAARVESAPGRNGVIVEKNVPPPSSLGGDEFSRYRPSSVPLAANENSASRSNRVYQVHVSDSDSILNGKEADEFSREPSPGFDVLVDDELRDADYYQNEEQFGRSRGHDGRNLNLMNDYDLGRSTGYNSVADVERDIYRDPHDCDSYERMQGQYAWEEHRASSERILGGSAHLERRLSLTDESPDQIDESDLRHRISKQRRGSGLRSVVSREHTRENHAEDWNGRPPRRDNHHATLQEVSLSSRLRGRIKIPGRSTSPVSDNDLRAQREIDVGRHRGGFSPVKLHTLTNQGRLRDRISRVNQGFNNEGRDFNNDTRGFRGSRITRDLVTDNDAEFARPKRLAELKVGRSAEGYEQKAIDRQSLGKRKYPKMESQQQLEGNLSFEGPKPLSEILKRKRGAETTSRSGNMSGDNDNNQEVKESTIRSALHSNKEETVYVPGDLDGVEKQTASIETEQVKSTDVESSIHHDPSELENEEGLIDEDAMDDPELEAYDHGVGDYDYEQVDGEDYNLDEGENPDDYLDEDDGDDFAKKIGVVFS